MMLDILNLAILDSAILQKNSDSNWFNLTQTYSLWINLMMAAIFNSAMLD